MFKRLSYPLSADMPVSDPILAPPIYEPIESIARGDMANLYRLTMFNHCGTHIDAPNHYDLTGKKLVDFSIDHFIFEKPLLLDIPKMDQGLITEE
ncbi:MAG: cyclase family protein, partial [Terriglobia bacterium]